jgi:hypothetical protein
MLASLQGATIFFRLDLQSAYHQIRIQDVPKTAFNTPMGHFQFKVLLFGMSNAPAVFQLAMQEKLHTSQWHLCAGICDDTGYPGASCRLEQLRAATFFAKLKSWDTLFQVKASVPTPSALKLSKPGLCSSLFMMCGASWDC